MLPKKYFVKGLEKMGASAEAKGPRGTSEDQCFSLRSVGGFQYSDHPAEPSRVWLYKREAKKKETLTPREWWKRRDLKQIRVLLTRTGGQQCVRSWADVALHNIGACRTNYDYCLGFLNIIYAVMYFKAQN